MGSSILDGSLLIQYAKDLMATPKIFEAVQALKSEFFSGDLEEKGSLRFADIGSYTRS